MNTNLQHRAEIAMWGSFACAQPWLVAGSSWAAIWLFCGMAAWLVARMAGKPESTIVVEQRYTGYNPRPSGEDIKPPPPVRPNAELRGRSRPAG